MFVLFSFVDLYSVKSQTRKYYYDFPDIKLEDLYGEERESYFRRFEVSFFLAIPFTAIISLLPFLVYEGFNQGRTDPYFTDEERLLKR